MIVCVPAALDVMPPPLIVSVLEPPITNWPALLSNVTLLTLRLEFTIGVNRVVPAKLTLAVPLLTGAPLGFQLFPVVQLLLLPPPSQV